MNSRYALITIYARICYALHKPNDAFLFRFLFSQLPICDIIQFGRLHLLGSLPPLVILHVPENSHLPSWSWITQIYND